MSHLTRGPLNAPRIWTLEGARIWRPARAYVRVFGEGLMTHWKRTLSVGSPCSSSVSVFPAVRDRLCRRLRGLCLRLSSAEASVSTTKLLCVLALPQLCKSAELCMLSHPPGGNLQNKVKVEKTTQRGQNTEAWKDYRGWDKTGAVSLQYRRSLLPPLTLRFI